MAKKRSSSIVLVTAVVAVGITSAVAGSAQPVGSLCPVEGFDICFPNIDDGAPNAACNALEPGAAAITACLVSVCSGVAREPIRGFFTSCCARGGSVNYEDSCVLAVLTACPRVADHCDGRCPSLELLLSGAEMSPPGEACFAAYPPSIARVCVADPFCCTTSWDNLCATTALEG